MMETSGQVAVASLETVVKEYAPCRTGKGFVVITYVSGFLQKSFRCLWMQSATYIYAK